MQPPLCRRPEAGGADPQAGGNVAMARRAVPPSLWSGHERLRIGERLQASLAGLLELDLLRETQREAVQRALQRGRRDGERQQAAAIPSVDLSCAFSSIRWMKETLQEFIWD